MCCHQRRSNEANIFHVLSIPSGSGSTINFLKLAVLLKYFAKEMNLKKTEITINAELQVF